MLAGDDAVETPHLWGRETDEAADVVVESAEQAPVPGLLARLTFSFLRSLNDFALVAMLGLLGLRIFEATGTDIDSLSEVHGHQVLRVHGKGDKIALVPLPPAVNRAVNRAAGDREHGPILRSRTGRRMDRHCATRRLRNLAKVAGVSVTRMHPHMLRHTYVTTMLDAGVDLRDVQIAARHVDPRTTMRHDRARKNLDRHPNYILAAYMASGT